MITDTASGEQPHASQRALVTSSMVFAFVALSLPFHHFISTRGIQTPKKMMPENPKNLSMSGLKVYKKH
jgi:hypothetical protein